MPRAGIVTVAGKPNVGKSTLLNRIVGQKLSITSPKPQSTRDRIVGIHTTDNAQMVILDTPGLLNPKYPLQQAMRSTAVRALEEADVIIYLADATEGLPPSLSEAAELSAPPQAPVIVALNKSDALNSVRREELASNDGVVLVSALTGDGVPDLMARVARLLPESPFLYPEDEISTQPVRFFVAELVRETVLEQLHDEVPYSVAVQVEEYREGSSPLYIRAVIYVERESQKAIIVGGKGARIKSLGEAARKKIETLVGEKVYLDLWVKVLANWRKNPGSLSRFGYQLATGKGK
ncbi:MAG TPA: GTPase Era [Gemmatimonadaceae bacterium]|nr:GTPase Era [Gemmatimonadaceae bacterium]